MGTKRKRILPKIQAKSSGYQGFQVFGTSKIFVFAPKGRVFSYYSYFVLKGHLMDIGFSPNCRAGSKEVSTVLLTVKRSISWPVLVFGTAVSRLVMYLGV